MEKNWGDTTSATLKFDIWVMNSKILSFDDYSIFFCMGETYNAQ